jgi:hypothetical protein
VRVFVLHPIVPAFEKHSGRPVIADGGVNLEPGARIPQEPRRNALFEVLVVQAAQAEVLTVLVRGFVVLLTPPATSRDHIRPRGCVLIPLRVTHTLLLSLNKSISRQPGVLVALLDVLRGEEWS